jgi:hypothetical protein
VADIARALERRNKSGVYRVLASASQRSYRCTDFEVLCRKLLQFCFSLEQHYRQKLAWQEREGTPE